MLRTSLRAETEITHNPKRRSGKRWCLRWRTTIMRASAFEYFRTQAEAEAQAEAIHHPTRTVY